MRRNVQEDYGQKFNFDTQWKGPLTIERKRTDSCLLVFFLLYLVVWICVGVYAISTGEMKADILDPDSEYDHGSKRSTSETRQRQFHFKFSFSRRAMHVACAFAVVAILMNYLSLILMNNHPKTLYYSTSLFTLFVFVVIAGAMVAYIPYALKHKRAEIFTFLLIMSIVLAIIIMVMIYYLILFRKKIRMACAIIQESVKAVMFFPSALSIPVLEIILWLVPAVFAALTHLHLLGHPQLKYEDAKPIRFYVLEGLNLFGFLWTVQFIYAFSKMVLSGTYATWYWSLDKDQIPAAVICRFMQITMRFHLGTIAFGSLIIAIFQLIRNLLESKKHESRRQGDIVYLCLSVLCVCVEGIVYFINANAYIMCIIHGSAFFQSGKDAFHLIKRNVMNIIVVRDVITTITCPLLVLVFAVTLGGTYVFCRHMTQPEILAAVLVVAILTIIVSILVFKVVGVAIDTVFLCAMEDFERNDGSNARPNFMSPALKQLLILNN